MIKIRHFQKLSSISISSFFTLKQTIFHPFIILSSPTFLTSNHPFLHQDLNHALNCITTIDEAQALFHFMLHSNPKPHIQNYHKLLHIVLKMEHYCHVIIMFKKLKGFKGFKGFEGFELDEYFMSSLIYSYCHLKEVKMGFAVIGDFLKRGFSPNIVCFNCLMLGLFLQGDVEEGVGVFKRVVKELDVDEFSVPIVLNGLCKSGNVGGAVELVRISEERDWEVGVVGYSAVIDGLCRKGMLREGVEVLFRMIGRDVLPNVVTYNILIHGLCKYGEVRFARSLFNELPSKGIERNVITYSVMIQGHCKEEEFREAKEMVEEMGRLGISPSRATYNIIIQTCLQLRHYRNLDCVNLLREIVGREFEICGTTFFQLVGFLKVIREMPGVYDDYVINQLIRKLTSSRALHQKRDKDSNEEFMIRSFRQKLIS